MLSFEELSQPYPEYKIEPQSYPFSGWIVRHKQTGCWVYSGGNYTLEECINIIEKFLQERNLDYWLRRKKDCYASHIGCPMQTICEGPCEMANHIATPVWGFPDPDNSKLDLIVFLIVLLTIVIPILLK